MFYRKLIFKGRTTVVVVDAIFGISFPTSYILDGDFIRIQTDKSDLLLEIKDANMLLGEGWAVGTFNKVNWQFGNQILPDMEIIDIGDKVRHLTNNDYNMSQMNVIKIDRDKVLCEFFDKWW